jgi:hypothetical protein
MELLLKSKTVQEHFITKEPVFHSRLANSLIKELSIFLQITVSAFSTSYFSKSGSNTYRYGFTSLLNLLNFISSSKSVGSLRVQSTNIRIQFFSVFLWEFSAKGVDRNVDSSSISFKLVKMKKGLLFCIRLHLTTCSIYTCKMSPMTSAVGPPNFWQKS